MFKAELGVGVAELDRRLLRAKDEAGKAESMPLGSHGGGREQVDIINLNPGGTSATYLARRIARDRPDILERMKAGDFRSVRQAAIAAGIITPPTPLDDLRRAWRKATEGERRQFFFEAAEELGEHEAQKHYPETFSGHTRPRPHGRGHPGAGEVSG